MAKTTQTKLNKHYRWISQDDHMTELWQVLFSSWLNLNSNTYQVTVNPEIEEWRLTNGHKMFWWFYVEDSGWNRTAACAGEDWEVYKVIWADNVPDYTFSDWRDVRNAINMGDYIYFVRPSGSWQIRVWRTTKSNTNLTNITDDISTTWDTLPNGTIFSTYPMFNFNNNVLLIWVGGQICAIEDSWIVTNYNIFASDIVSITRVWWKFRIYSSNGEIAFWRYWQLAIDESYNIDDYQNWYLRWAINRWGIDIMISGFNSSQTDIRAASWYEAPVIAHYEQSQRFPWKKFKVKCRHPRHLTRIWDTIFFINETGDTSEWLWSYGYKNVIFWDAFQEERLLTNGSINSVYWFQWPWNDYVYMWTNVGAIHRISSYEVNWSPSWSWEMYYNIMDWWDPTAKKKMKGLFNTISDCSDGNTVEIQASYNNQPHESLRVYDSSVWIDRREIKVTSKEFTDIVMKAIITWWAKHHAIRIQYEVIEE